FSLFALGDVDDDPEELLRFAFGVEANHPPAVDPDVSTIPMSDPKLSLEGAPALRCFKTIDEHRPVLRMEDAIHALQCWLEAGLIQPIDRIDLIGPRAALRIQIYLERPHPAGIQC